jgi:peptidoglycan/xylan/chitin deacetylase (PgdA/CDA1 family)
MLKLPLRLASPGGQRGRLSILIFHRVLAQQDPLFPDVPTAGDFEVRLRWVKAWFNVLPLNQAIDRLYAGTIPSRALSITFDDGYADNETIAAPILARLGLSATFFVATGFLDGDCMWNDRVIEAIRGCDAESLDLRACGLARYSLASISERRRVIDSIIAHIKRQQPTQRAAATQAIVAAAGGPPAPVLMMQPQQVRNLRSLGMEVGAHTVTHPILTRLSADAAHEEMARSKRELQEITGEPVLLFAYPNGVPGTDYAIGHAAMARDCGFSAAVSTAWGAASRRSDRYQLPRFSPWDRTRLRYGVRLLRNLAHREQVAG